MNRDDRHQRCKAQRESCPHGEDPLRRVSVNTVVQSYLAHGNNREDDVLDHEERNKYLGRQSELAVGICFSEKDDRNVDTHIYCCDTDHLPEAFLRIA